MTLQLDVVAYDPEWRASFQALSERLQSALSDFNPRIEHIGSTAVEGLWAKPIIDIAVGLPSADMLDLVVSPMIEMGALYYAAFNAHMPDRRLFVLLNAPASALALPNVFTDEEAIPHEVVHAHRVAHVHVWVEGSSAWRRHIAFREYLRMHPDVCAQYAELKRTLSTRRWENGMAYNNAKDAFMKKTEAEALKWFDDPTSGRPM